MKEQDPLGRIDVFLIEGIRRLVVSSGEPAYLAMYGRFGGLVNDFITEHLGPVNTKVQK